MSATQGRAVREPGKFAQFAEHRRARQVQGLAQRQRRQRIGRVVAAAELQFLQRQEPFAAAREPLLSGVVLQRVVGARRRN